MTEHSAELTQLHKRGFLVLPPMHDAAYLAAAHAALDALHAEFGRPAPSSGGGRTHLSDDTSISSVGMTFAQIFVRRPELAADFLPPSVVSLLTAIFGGPPQVETSGAMLSDANRPMHTWHCHIGGLDEERVDQADPTGLPPDRVRRLTVLLYLDAISANDGPLWVQPRSLADPLGCPYPGRERHAWPEQEVVAVPAGTMVLLEERTWHAALPLVSAGLRRFLGTWLVSTGSPPTQNRDPSAAATQALLFGA